MKSSKLQKIIKEEIEKLLKESEGITIDNTPFSPKGELSFDRTGVKTAKRRASMRVQDEYGLSKLVDSISDSVLSLIQSNPTKADNAYFLRNVFNKLLTDIKVLDSKVRDLRKGQPAMEVPEEFIDID